MGDIQEKFNMPGLLSFLKCVCTTSLHLSYVASHIVNKWLIHSILTTLALLKQAAAEEVS